MYFVSVIHFKISLGNVCLSVLASNQKLTQVHGWPFTLWTPQTTCVFVHFLTIMYL